MPYVLELDFDETELVSIQDHIHLEKIYNGFVRAMKRMMSN